MTALLTLYGWLLMSTRSWQVYRPSWCRLTAGIIRSPVSHREEPDPSGWTEVRVEFCWEETQIIFNKRALSLLYDTSIRACKSGHKFINKEDYLYGWRFPAIDFFKQIDLNSVLQFFHLWQIFSIFSIVTWIKFISISQRCSREKKQTSSISSKFDI